MNETKTNVSTVSCIKSTANSIHTRRCFITGEYCSQQTNIQKIRKKLHSKTDDKGEPAPEINAFVVMNFSSISDVVYESKIKPFIEGLNKYLYLDTKSDRIACVSTADLGDLRDSRLVSFSDIKGKILEASQTPTVFLANLEKYTQESAREKVAGQLPNSEFNENALSTYLRSRDKNNALVELFNDLPWKENGQAEYYHSLIWKPVSKIHVHRADSNPVSNYIICNRICQQMQMADLIIVDVSVESANIFYEFGLATAFHKLILPICFSGSYYKMELPPKLEASIQKRQAELALETPKDNDSEMHHMPKKLERHIDCFPWRRSLFEHFGIRRQKNKLLSEQDTQIDEQGLTSLYDGVRYLKYSLASLTQYGFSDIKYNRFPYTEDAEINGERKSVGSLIYSWLQKSFNCASAGVSHNAYNTLIVYTMECIEDKEQAGQCIVNFYNNITKPMREKHCFCGDRVAILGQPNRVWDDPKDNRNGIGLPYNVSDLIRLGMDQATYESECKRIKTEDYLNPSLDFTPDAVQTDNVEIQVKSHIRNRAFQLNPDNPIYVTYLKDGIQKNIPNDVIAQIETLDGNANNNEHYFFCLYHVMLDTLRYANEIVVDLSSNSVQSMFWLGAAHGSDIYAVTVRHEMTEQEKPWSGEQRIQKDRTILDISGLWTAMFRRNETANFYKQLELIQLGIDQHARLKLPEMELESFEKETLKQLYQSSPFVKWGKEEGLNEAKNPRINEIHSSFIKKNRAESRALESYYRDRFWRQMHRDNQLHLFLDLHPTTEQDEPKSMTSKWDLDAIAELSQYLSKRKVISRYQIDTIKTDGDCGWNDPESGRNAAEENFIVIGSAPKPLQYTAEGKNDVVSLSEYVHWEKQCRAFLYEKANVSKVSCKENKYEIRYFSNGTEKYEVQFLKHSCISAKCTTPSDCIKNAQTIQNCSNKIFPKDDSVNGTQYLLPAQLLLWREKQKGSTANYKYHVSLCGASGPATKALTALLVDEEQKWGIWGNHSDGLNKDVNEHLLRYLPLNTLQAYIRKDFYKKFEERFQNGTGDIKIALYLSLSYLSTILPQYFLPFLSHSDEKRIYHGLEAFLRMTGGQDTAMFEDAINQHTSTILKALEETLFQFRGVDALYGVSVSAKTASSSNTDDRSITDIRLLRKDDEDMTPVINCLYVDDKPD